MPSRVRALTVTNEPLREPSPPHPFVNSSRCICGATYDGEHYGVRFSHGVAHVRATNQPNGGYRSRGPVLWAMHVLKLEAWYAEHRRCQDEGLAIYQETPADLPF